MADLIHYRFRLRRANSATWVSLNDVLLDGEIGYEKDTGRYKTGDGVTAWNALNYNGPGQVDLDGLQDGDVLIWNDSQGIWEPGQAGSGGSGEAPTPFVYDSVFKSPPNGVGSSVDVVIPNIADGDLLFLSVLRRASISVSDENSGVWDLAGDVYGEFGGGPSAQGTSVYTRIGSHGDSGKTITVAYSSGSAHLLVSLLVIRGTGGVDLYPPVIESRVPGTSDPVSLEGISPPRTGLLIRALSWIYANSTAENSQGEVSDSTNHCPIVGSSSPTYQVRIQVCSKVIDSYDLIEQTITRNTSHVDDYVYDVSFILKSVGVQAVEEAPKDGKVYGRKDGEWVEIVI